MSVGQLQVYIENWTKIASVPFLRDRWTSGIIFIFLGRVYRYCPLTHWLEHAQNGVTTRA